MEAGQHRATQGGARRGHRLVSICNRFAIKKNKLLLHRQWDVFPMSVRACDASCCVCYVVASEECLQRCECAACAQLCRRCLGHARWTCVRHEINSKSMQFHTAISNTSWAAPAHVRGWNPIWGAEKKRIFRRDKRIFRRGLTGPDGARTESPGRERG